MKISKVEIVLIAGAALNALAELADFLPADIGGKVTASLLALWAVLRFVLRLLQAIPDSANSHLAQIESLRAELHDRIGQIERPK